MKKSLIALACMHLAMAPAGEDGSDTSGTGTGVISGAGPDVNTGDGMAAASASTQAESEQPSDAGGSSAPTIVSESQDKADAASAEQLAAQAAEEQKSLALHRENTIFNLSISIASGVAAHPSMTDKPASAVVQRSREIAAELISQSEAADAAIEAA